MHNASDNKLWPHYCNNNIEKKETKTVENEYGKSKMKCSFKNDVFALTNEYGITTPNEQIKVKI